MKVNRVKYNLRKNKQVIIDLFIEKYKLNDQELMTILRKLNFSLLNKIQDEKVLIDFINSIMGSHLIAIEHICSSLNEVYYFILNELKDYKFFYKSY